MNQLPASTRTSKHTAPDDFWFSNSEIRDAYLVSCIMLEPAQNRKFLVGDGVDVYDATTRQFVMRGYITDILASGKLKVAEQVSSYGYLINKWQPQLVLFHAKNICGPFEPEFCRYASGSTPPASI